MVSLEGASRFPEGDHWTALPLGTDPPVKALK